MLVGEILLGMVIWLWSLDSGEGSWEQVLLEDKQGLVVDSPENDQNDSCVVD